MAKPILLRGTDRDRLVYIPAFSRHICPPCDPGHLPIYVGHRGLGTIWQKIF